MEIYGTDKNDAKQAILESVPPESIEVILTPEEYQRYISSTTVKTSTFGAGAENIETGNDFANNIINSAISLGEAKAKEKQIQNTIPVSTEIKLVSKPIVIDSKPKYFIDGGIQYKFDAGQLYKKIWKTVEINEYMNDNGEKVFPEYRIINKETGKTVKSEKYSVQQLQWEQIKTE